PVGTRQGLGKMQADLIVVRLDLSRKAVSGDRLVATIAAFFHFPSPNQGADVVRLPLQPPVQAMQGVREAISLQVSLSQRFQDQNGFRLILIRAGEKEIL